MLFTEMLTESLKRIAEWRDRVRWREELAAFTPRQLNDIGLSPARAWCEAGKPFWQA